MNTVLVLIIFSIIFISFFQSVLMIAANEYIKNTENFFLNKRRNYIKYIKLNFKKLFKSILAKNQNKINGTILISNFLMIFTLLLPIILVVVDSLGFRLSITKSFLVYIKSFYLVYAVVIIFSVRLINYISSNYEIDINKMILKGFVSLALVILNFSFVDNFVRNIEVFAQFKMFLKVYLFFNTALSIYIFDNFTKNKKKKSMYQKKLIDKVVLYFMLLGSFLLLNNNNSEIQITRFFYYSVSIYLIDFLAAYATKAIGHIKMFQTIKLSYEYIFIYYLVFYLFLMMVSYGI